VLYCVPNVPLARLGETFISKPYKGRRSCSPPLGMLSHSSPHSPFMKARDISLSCLKQTCLRPKGFALWKPTTFEKVDETFKDERKAFVFVVYRILWIPVISNPIFLYKSRAFSFHSATCNTIGSLFFFLIYCIPHNKSCFPYPLC